MRKIMTLGLAATTAISAVAFSTAASAYDYRDYYRRDNDNNTAATAVIAGVVGLAIGAAIAGNHNTNSRYYGNSYGYGSSPYYGSGYGSGYGYGSNPYGSSYGYGTSPYYGSGYGSGYGYGASPYGYSPYGGSGYAQRCTTTRTWDPYARRYVSRQICR